MKKVFLYLSFCTVALLLFACGNNPEQQKVEQEAAGQVKTDQERMDSMDRVIQQQMQSVSDDSVLKSVQE